MKKTITKFLSLILSTLLFTQGTLQAGIPVTEQNYSTRVQKLDKVLTTTVKEQQNDTYWVNKGAEWVSKQCSTIDCVLTNLYNAEKQANDDILQAVICNKDKSECIPALAYAQGGVHYALNHWIIYNNQIIKETSGKFIELVTEYGLHSEQDRQKAINYFYALIETAYSDCKDSAALEDTSRFNTRRTNFCAEETSAMPAVAMLAKTPAEKQYAAKKIYGLMESRYNKAGGGMIMMNGTAAIGVLNTAYAYSLLEKFLTDDTVPSVVGNVIHGVGSPAKVSAQNAQRLASNLSGGNSRYLNRINEKFQFLDEEEAKRQKFTNTAWQSDGLQYPYNNVMEELGKFLGQQSAYSPLAKNLSKKIVHQANEYAKEGTNAAGTIHYPLVLGILDGWRLSGKQFIYEPAPSLLSLFYKGDWFDINEGTQRRVHYKAYQFAKARGWTWKEPLKDNDKIISYSRNERALAIAEAGDVLINIILLGTLADSLYRGVGFLLKHSSWVGTKNFISNLPRTMKGKVFAPKTPKVNKPVRPVKPTTKPAAPKATSATQKSTSVAPKTPKQAAKAELEQAQQNARQAQADYNANFDLYGQSYNAKVNSFTEKVRTYNGFGPEPEAPQFTEGELALKESYDALNSSLASLDAAKANWARYGLSGFFNRNIFNPFKNWWKAPRAPEISDFPITAMETGEGTTLAKTLGLKDTYTPPAVGEGGFYTSNGTNWAYKTYDWLNAHNMPKLANFLKVANNKATVLGTALMFYYNTATINPSTLQAAERIIPLTELVTTAPKAMPSVIKTFAANPVLKVKPATALSVDPVAIVDPKMLQAYGTMPLPSGAALNGSLINFSFVSASKLASSIYNTAKFYTEAAKPFSFAGTAGYVSPSLSFYNVHTAMAKTLILPAVLSTGTAAAQPAAAASDALQPAAEIEQANPWNTLEDNLSNKVAQDIRKDFTAREKKADVKRNISLIEKTGRSTQINMAAYSARYLQLIQAAPYLTTTSFINLSNLLTGDYAEGRNKLEEIAVLISKKEPGKKDLAKLDENIIYYVNGLKQFDSYIQLISATTKADKTKPFFNIPFLSTKKFIQGEAPSVEAMDTKAFALALGANFFDSVNMRKAFETFVNKSAENKVLAVLPALIKTNTEIKTFADKHPGVDKKGIKGCLISTSSKGEWEDITNNLTPQNIGISVETQIEDMSKVIAEWMHKKDIPLKYKGNIQVQEVLDNLIPWAEDMIGVTAKEAFTYVNDGELHVYNKEHTKRIRFGKHESKPGKPHIHIETIENKRWHGIDNKAYYFASITPAYSDLILEALNALKDHFISLSFLAAVQQKRFGGRPQRILYIIGGPNASGKTRLYNQLLANSGLPYLNQDKLAQEQNISPREAGVQTLAMIEDMFTQNKSFVYESTLSGRNVIQMIKKAHDKGYRVVIIYTFVNNPETSIARAKKRVEEGGHSVPFDQLTDRYYKSRNNFWNIYKDMADDWIMYRNTDTSITPIAAKTLQINRMEILDEAAYQNTVREQESFKTPMPASN